MKITILNGSPKGDPSVTMQYANFIRKHSPDHDYVQFNVSREIARFEKDEAYFKAVIASVVDSDAVVWAFPVYLVLIPSQMMRFIELVFERNAQGAFSGKYATALSTSGKIFDDTAHRYIQAISEDLDMNFLPGFSSAMFDLVKPDKQQHLLNFAAFFFKTVQSRALTQRSHMPVSWNAPLYVPGAVHEPVIMGKQRVVVLTDATDKDTNLQAMIEVFCRSIAGPVEVVNLYDLDIRGGCTGCGRCHLASQCMYDDGFKCLYDEKLLPAHVIVFAAAIRGRFFSWKMKQFWDRSHYHSHKPVLAGRQTGYIISGPLQQLPELRDFIEFMGGGRSLPDFVTDESGDSPRITAQLAQLGQNLLWCHENRCEKPPMFQTIAYRKIIRDLVYEKRFVFQEDHRFYKKTGFYDFPNRSFKVWVENTLFNLIFLIPGIKRAFFENAVAGMLRPFKKVLES